MRYGLPYMGSKNDTAKQIVDILPAADVLIDLFAGGCAVTHAALLSGKWKRIIANDITDAPRLFWDAIHGKYHDCDKWISRDEFYLTKDKDAFTRICWSFGNSQKNYLYSRELEPYKKAIHKCLFGKTVKKRYLGFRAVINEMKKISQPKRLNELESLERLERLQSLESLERLESLQSLEILQKDYKEIPPPQKARLSTATRLIAARRVISTTSTTPPSTHGVSSRPSRCSSANIHSRMASASRNGNAQGVCRRSA